MAAGLGLALLLSRLPPLFTALKVAGGLYLLWLAGASARRLFQRRALPASPAIIDADDPAQAHHAWREGLSVNLLNPSIAMFYLAVVPSFVPATAPGVHYVWLAATHVLMAFMVHTAWVLALDRLRDILIKPSARLVLEGVTAIALLLLALRVLATSRS